MKWFNLDYNPKVCCLPHCSNCSSFGHWEFFLLVSWVPLTGLFSLNVGIRLLAGTTRCPRLILCFPGLSPRGVRFSEGPWFRYWRMAPRIQDLCAGRSRCPWGGTAAGASADRAGEHVGLLGSKYMGGLESKNDFIEIQFTNHTIHALRCKDSMAFSLWPTRLKNFNAVKYT